MEPARDAELQVIANADVSPLHRARRDVRERLSNVADLERLALKLRYGRALPRDLASLRAALMELGPLAAAVGACPDILALAPIFQGLDRCEEPLALLGSALADDPALRLGDGHVVRSGYDPALDEARALLENGQARVTELERGERREWNGVADLERPRREHRDAADAVAM